MEFILIIELLTIVYYSKYLWPIVGKNPQFYTCPKSSENSFHL